MAEIKSQIGTQNKKGQTFTDAWKMMNEAPEIRLFIPGARSLRKPSDVRAVMS